MTIKTQMTTMILYSKGATASVKSLVRDLSFIIPNVQETKYDIKKQINVLNSLMEMNECNNTIFFECTKRIVRLWIVNNACSMRFKINDLQSIYDLSNLTNYHKKGGHILLFTDDFNQEKYLGIKKMFQEAFSPYEDASIERSLCFYQINDQIFIRNYLIETGEEIGPRINIELDLILNGCFKGNTLYRKKENNDSEMKNLNLKESENIKIE